MFNFLCINILIVFFGFISCNTFVNELVSTDHLHVHCSHEHPKADEVWTTLQINFVSQIANIIDRN